MLPVQTMIDTYEALGDWRFTAQEANQIIVSVWDSVMGAIMLTGAIGMFGMIVTGKISVKDELESIENEIRKTSAKLHDLEENAAHAREHYQNLMREAGFGVEPPLVKMSSRMKLAKKRQLELEGKAERMRGYLFKLTRRRKELTGEA
jgi:hypothetical protein